MRQEDRRGLVPPRRRGAPRDGDQPRCYAPRCRRRATEWVQSMPTAGPHPACPEHADRFCDTAYNYDGTWSRRWPLADGPGP